MMECECGETFNTNKGFCDECCIKRKTDVCEIITDNILHCKTIEEAETILKTMPAFVTIGFA